MSGLLLFVLFIGGVFGASSGNWGVAVIVALIASIVLAIIGRDTKFQVAKSIAGQFCFFFIISEIIVLLAYLIVEMDLLGQIAKM